VRSSEGTPAAAARPARRARRRIPDWLYGLGTVAALLALWEFASVQGWLGTHQLPPPSKLAGTFQQLLERGFPRGLTADVHIWATLWRIIRGYALATALALPLGILIGASPLLDRATAPVITFARSVATISLLPLAVAWFGVGEETRIFLITYACFWIILTSVVDAVKGVPAVYIRAAQTLGASRRQIFFQVMLPASLPRIFAGMRVALGVAFLVIVAVEMIGTVTGLGALIMEARTFYRSDIAVVGMIFIAIIGFAIAKVLDIAERLLLPWASSLDEVQR
jgi:ABC-type nitrate/sulfonate/bicarbonate transport system permease component